MKIKLVSLLALCLTFSFVKAQTNVGINTTAPHASAALDVTSTTQGLLIPRMSTTQRNAISSPAAGLMVYDNTLNSFYYYNGTAWGQIGAASSPFFNINALIGSTNVSGNGTYYLNGTTGATATETDAHHILTASATKVVFTVIASGMLNSPYTYTIRRGTVTGGVLTFADLGSSITLSGSQVQIITVTGLTLQPGETLSVKMVGTQSVSSSGKAIYYSLTAQ